MIKLLKGMTRFCGCAEDVAHLMISNGFLEFKLN